LQSFFFAVSFADAARQGRHIYGESAFLRRFKNDLTVMSNISVSGTAMDFKAGAK